MLGCRAIALPSTKQIDDKYMPFVMNIVIMCYVHHLSTERRENLQIVPKSTPTDTNKTSPTI